MTDEVYVVIPARGGSKGVPEKNLTYFNGSTLIENTIKLACSITTRENIIITTNDDEISQISLSNGVKVIRRSAELSTDDVTLDPVIYNALESVGVSNPNALIITLQVTSPNLSRKTLLSAIKFIDDEQLDTLISAKPSNHLTWTKQGTRVSPNYTKRLNRQDMPDTFQETGAFLISRYSCVTINNRIGENAAVFVLPENEADDIDSVNDFSNAINNLANRKIAFKVIGNKTVGTGHVFHCLELARRLPDFQKKFFVTDDDDFAFNILQSRHYDIEKHSPPELNLAIREYGPKLIILDKLDTTITEVQDLKSFTPHVISFEDLGSGSHYTDMTFNPLYPATMKQGSILSGPAYFLPKSSFLQKRSITKVKKDLLVFFGGTDPSNHTERLINELKRLNLPRKFQVTVLLGLGANLTTDSLDYIQETPNIILETFCPDICELILSHRLALTSAGRTMYELAFLKVPFIVCYQNDREKIHLTDLERNERLPVYQAPNELAIQEAVTLLEDEEALRNLSSSLSNIGVGEKSYVIEQNIRKLMQNV